MKPNEGEVPQYYVEGSHPAIVSAELFDHVQSELKRRKGIRYVASSGCFAGRIVCGDCGTIYGAKVWHSNSKYRRTVWQCNGKFKGAEKCSTPHFYEDQLKEVFVNAMNSLIADRDSVIEAYEDILRSVARNKDLEAERDSLQDESDVVLELMRKMVLENSRTALDQSEYQHRYNALVERYDRVQEDLAEVNKTIEARNTKRLQLQSFIKMLKKQDGLLTEFDEELWYAVVDKLMVWSATELTFIFKDGTELPWTIG